MTAAFPPDDDAARAPAPNDDLRHIAGDGEEESGEPCLIRPLHETEREAIEQAIAYCGGNIPRAAALLKIAPSTIYRKQSAWLHPPANRPVDQKPISP